VRYIRRTIDRPVENASFPSDVPVSAPSLSW
jgi:hypothetical protein